MGALCLQDKNKNKQTNKKQQTMSWTEAELEIIKDKRAVYILEDFDV